MDIFYIRIADELATDEQEENMALTKKQLTEWGIESDLADKILNGHIESIEGLQNKNASLESRIEKLEAATNSSKTEATNSDGEKAAKEGGAVNAEIEALKQQIAEMKQAAKDKEVREAKTAAYKELLKESGITNEKRIAAILKVTDFNGVKLSKDGTISNKDDLTTGIKNDYEAFIETVETKGANTATPPQGEEKKNEPNQRFIDRIAAHRASLYGEQPGTAEGG